MDIKAALSRVAERQDLSLDEMRDVMRQVMTGEAGDAQIGAFLMGMRLKGETVDRDHRRGDGDARTRHVAYR